MKPKKSFGWKKTGIPPFEIWIPDVSWVPWVTGIDYGSTPGFTAVLGIGLKPPEISFESLAASLSGAFGVPHCAKVPCECWQVKAGEPLKIVAEKIVAEKIAAEMQEARSRETPEEREARLNNEIEIKRLMLREDLRSAIRAFDLANLKGAR